MSYQVLQAGPDDVRARADAFLSEKLEVSRAKARQILKSATLDGQPIKPSYNLREGDELTFDAQSADEQPPSHAKFSDAELAREIPILFEDDDLLVINKPRDLSVHPGAGEAQVTLVDLLRARGISLSDLGPLHRAGIVHRLDKDTSGAMIIAKTNAAHENLAAQFGAREVEKEYFALIFIFLFTEKLIGL